MLSIKPSLKKVSVVISFSALLFMACRPNSNDTEYYKQDGADTAILAFDTAFNKATRGETTILKDYGITSDSMTKLMKLGIQPLTLKQQRIEQQKVYLDDWIIKTDSDFNKTIHIEIHSGEKAKTVVAVKITIKGNGCDFNTTFQRKLILKPNDQTVIAHKLGSAECEKIFVTEMKYVLEDGSEEYARIPLPIERLINNELKRPQ